MTERRRAIFILVLAALLLGLIIAVVLIVVRRATPAPIPEGPVTIEAPPLTPEQRAAASAIQNPLAPSAVETPPGRTAAAQMAELFAERFGSYSNQGDFQNLRDLLPVMTAKYRAQTEASLASAPKPTPTFEGVTSVKVSTDVRLYDETAGTAIVAVTLQQEKTSGVSNVVGYRTLRMELKREKDEWRVDTSRWENALTPAS